ncbi:conjugal transfer protein [Streptomyces sp. RM72]|uniref:conjugal transfer protein n=1 Tax=Streptomyces sp. RM72 TaxID=1115510 RepID=UPI001B39AEBF|nr:conjugal transfer protein [Streptomyces sp. RM72]MBQ0890716.1 conjugal transfer protein [Streptomyces sp. RM72]
MSALRKMLNLPPKEPKGGEEENAASGDVSVGTPLPESEKGRTPSRAPAALGWAEEEESSGRSAVRKAGRVAIWLVIGLAAFTGVRTWIFPAKPPAPIEQADPQAEARKNNVPEAEAQQVAARFARSYLTWNAADPDARAKELEADLAKGIDPKLGWNGAGVQLVAQTIPGTVTQVGGKRARVRVDVRVSVVTGSGNKTRTATSWRGLEVPVAQGKGRVVVTGQPAMVGMPTAAEYKAPDVPEADSQLSGLTRETVADFLKSWAAGDADQAAAPGADIQPLGSGLRLDSLDTWVVDAGSGDKRTGTATVRWKLGGAQIQQTYQITLTKVSASSASRWQVEAVTAKTA